MSTNVRIEKSSKTPIHHQLYSILKEEILSGHYREHDTIPSEQEMQNLYKVSRITVRRAISDLEHDGFVKKQRGKGTVVLPLKNFRDLQTFQSFSGDAKIRGDVPGSIILKCEVMDASVKVCEMLKLPANSKVSYLKRLRLLNGRIIALHETFVSLNFGFVIKEEDFGSQTSLYSYIEEHGVILGSADETVEARMPSSDVKKQLFIEENMPVIYKERVTFNDQGVPIEYSENTYIADRYKYNIHIVKVR